MNILKPYKYYAKEALETKACTLLKKMEATAIYDPTYPLDPGRVADFLNLSVVWDKIPPANQEMVSARIFPLQHLIEINEDIIDFSEGYESSTIAHEIGHWILHVDHDNVDQFLKMKQRGIKLEVQPFLCRNINEQKGIEWQAQYFASCLLMPEHILKEKRYKYDLTNWRDLYQMKDEFGVTISNLRHRLISLDWIVNNPNSKQIYLGKAAPSRTTKIYSD